MFQVQKLSIFAIKSKLVSRIKTQPLPISTPLLQHTTQDVYAHVQMQAIVPAINSGVFYISGSKIVDICNKIETGFAHKNSTTADIDSVTSTYYSVCISTCTNASNSVSDQ